MLSLGAGESDQGEILGIGQSISALARICGPIAGYAFLEFGLTTMPYISGAALMLLTATILAKIQKSPNRPEEHAPEEEISAEAAAEVPATEE